MKLKKLAGEKHVLKELSVARIQPPGYKKTLYKIKEIFQVEKHINIYYAFQLYVQYLT